MAELPSSSPPAGGPAWRSPAVWALVVANLLPLYGVLVLGWAVLPVVALFWLENVIIGVLNVLRIIVASPADTASWSRKLLLAPFFCVHYGMFTAVHGLVVFQLFGGEPYQALLDGLWVVDAAHAAIREYQLWPALAALAASHLFSFAWNFLGRGEFRRVRVAWLMQAPYGRVVVLHIALIFGALLIRELHSPQWALLLLIALKIGFDLRAHLRERRSDKIKRHPATGPGGRQ